MQMRIKNFIYPSRVNKHRIKRKGNVFSFKTLIKFMLRQKLLYPH